MQTRHGEFVEQTRQSLVKYRVAVARRPIAQRATNPTFADSGWPDQKDVEVLADPSASCQRLNRRTIQAAGSTQVEIFQARILAHAGAAYPLRQRGIELDGLLPNNDLPEAAVSGQRRHNRPKH